MTDELVTTIPTTVTIIDTTIPVLEYKGNRIITLSTIDKLHRRPEGTAGRNFREHKEKFEEGKHYFHIDYQELKVLNEFRRAGITPNPAGLIVITERGYSMLVKSFNDDFAWEVQDQLVDGYFESKKPMTTAEFLVKQANLILEHDNKIKKLEQRQNTSDVRIAETRQQVQIATQKAEEAFEAASAALRHKYGEPDYYTVVGFCNKFNIKLSAEESKVEGAHAAKLSREMDKNIVKIPDERWGQVNSYHVSVLQKIFKDRLKD